MHKFHPCIKKGPVIRYETFLVWVKFPRRSFCWRHGTDTQRNGTEPRDGNRGGFPKGDRTGPHISMLESEKAEPLVLPKNPTDSRRWGLLVLVSHH